MDKKKKLKGLLIAYYFSPLNGIATHRLFSFANYLNTSDFQLDVICPKWEGDLKPQPLNSIIKYTAPRVLDRNFGEIKPSGIRVITNFILNTCLRRNFFKSRKPGVFYKEVLAEIKKINMEEYDFILTSFAPLDAIHIGSHVKKEFPTIKWIIDYRDLYSLMEYYDLGVFRFFFKEYEKKITRSADAFITVSEVLRQKQEKLINKKGALIYNGFENYETEEDETFSETLKTIPLPIISYTGSLYQGERDIIPFLKYLKAKGIDEKYNCVFALINDFDECYLRKIIADLKIKNVIIKRNLTFNQSLLLHKYSVFLLLLANFNGRGNGYLTGKFFEYMEAKRPIIYSGCTNTDFELYQLIIKYQLGEYFDKINYDRVPDFSNCDLSFFHRKNQANELKLFIKKVVGHETNPDD